MRHPGSYVIDFHDASDRIIRSDRSPGSREGNGRQNTEGKREIVKQGEKGEMIRKERSKEGKKEGRNREVTEKTEREEPLD